MIKERPILFSGEMVRAILDGRKTQTRRVVKHQPELRTNGLIQGEWGLVMNGEPLYGVSALCPYGKPGDRLWVRETWRTSDALNHVKPINLVNGAPIQYCADHSTNFGDKRSWSFGDAPWRPSIFMLRWASRITLEVVNVRIERLQNIKEDDALSEGVETAIAYQHSNTDTACDLFIVLWDSINAKRGHSWASNPWVWVVEFKKV